MKRGGLLLAVIATMSFLAVVRVTAPWSDNDAGRASGAAPRELAQAPDGALFFPLAGKALDIEELPSPEPGRTPTLPPPTGTPTSSATPSPSPSATSTGAPTRTPEPTVPPRDPLLAFPLHEWRGSGVEGEARMWQDEGAMVVAIDIDSALLGEYRAEIQGGVACDQPFALRQLLADGREGRSRTTIVPGHVSVYRDRAHYLRVFDGPDETDLVACGRIPSEDPPDAQVQLQSRNGSDVEGVAAIWDVVWNYVDVELRLSSGATVTRPAAIHRAKSCTGILERRFGLAPAGAAVSETRFHVGEGLPELENGEHAVLLLYGEDDPRMAACGMIAFRDDRKRGCERINCGRPDRCTPGPPPSPTPRSCPGCPTPDPQVYCCPCIPR